MKAVIIVALAWMYLCSIGFRRYQRKEESEGLGVYIGAIAELVLFILAIIFTVRL